MVTLMVLFLRDRNRLVTIALSLSPIAIRSATVPPSPSMQTVTLGTSLCHSHGAAHAASARDAPSRAVRSENSIQGNGMLDPPMGDASDMMTRNAGRYILPRGRLSSGRSLPSTNAAFWLGCNSLLACCRSGSDYRLGE